MPTLPTYALRYYRTAELTEATIPKPLLWSHCINRPGVWARLVVSSGRLSYVRLDAPELPTTLEPGADAVIPPGERHKLVLQGPVRFHLEFYREEFDRDVFAHALSSFPI